MNTGTAPTIGLVLGSGAARGWSHIGVLRVLEEAGIRPDCICGTSVGAVVGAALASGELDALEEWVLGLDEFDLFRLLDPRLSNGGLLRGDNLVKAYGKFIADVDIAELPIPFTAVATDIETGREKWLRKGSLHNVIRASCALPGLFPPILFDDHWLSDGGLVNPVPVSVARAADMDVVIAVNLNGHLVGAPGMKHRYARPSEEDAGPNTWKRLQEWWATRGETSGSFMRALFSGSGGEQLEMPGIISVLTDASNIMQDRITRTRLLGEPPDALVSPRLGHIGLLEFNRAREAIDEGRRSAEKALPDIKQLLES